MADQKQRITVETRFRDNGVARGLDNIKDKSAKTFDGPKGLSALASKANLSIAALSAATVGLGVAMGRTVLGVAEQSDEIQKMSDRIGASTEALSQYRFVAERSGVQFRTLTMGWQRMTRRIAEAARGMGEARGALQELGLSASTLSKLAPEDQFEALAEELSKVGSQSDKVRLAMKLFDSEGVSLIQTMKGGAAGVQALREEADRLGLTLSSDAGKRAAEFQDQLTNMTAAADGLKKAFAEGVIVELGRFEDQISSPDMLKSASAFGGIIGTMTVKAAGLLGVLTSLHEIANLEAPAQTVARMAKENKKAEAVAAAVTGDSTPSSATNLLGQRSPNPNLANVNQTAPSAISQPISRLGPISLSSSESTRAGRVAGAGYATGFGSGIKNAERDLTRPGAGTTALNEIAFGKSGGAAGSIERQADNSGNRAASKWLQGWRTSTSKNVEDDVVGPMGELGTGLGTALITNMESSLTVGLSSFILEGDLKESAKIFGATLVSGMIVDASGQLASGIIGGLTNIGTGAGQQTLLNAGRSIGAKMFTGAQSSLLTPVADGFSNLFTGTDATGGSVGGAVTSGLTSALIGGVTGAAIGSLIGNQIQAKAGAIGGALGGAFKGPVGGLIGSLIGAVGSKALGFGAAADARKGAAGELATDIAAFGGLPGFFKRIGGLEGIKGERARQFSFQEGNDLITDTLRLSHGATKGQASDVANILGQFGARAFEGLSTNRIRLPNVQSSAGEIENLLKSIGLGNLVDRLSIGSGNQDGGLTGEGSIPSSEGPRDNTGRPGLYEWSDGTFRATPEPVSSGKPAGNPRLSISAGRAAFMGGYLSTWAEGLGAPIGSGKGNNIRNLIESQGQDFVARQYLDQFYDIQAATGFHGTVNRPTTILAGEGGRSERIDIGPVGGRDFQGAGARAGGVTLHYSATINALDSNGVDEAAVRLGERLRQVMLDMSERGVPVVYASGVVSPASV